MSYTSRYTGAQMDGAFDRITNTVTGKVTLTGSPNGGSASLITRIETDFVDPICMVTLKYPSRGVSGGISVMASYNASTQNLSVHLVGDGIEPDENFDVYYMLIE